MVHRMGSATSKRQARQMVNHGHFMVNGKPVNVTSFIVKPGDVIEVRETSRDIPAVRESIDKVEHRGLPAWIEMDLANFKGKVLHVPSREEMQLPFEIQEQLIVELYSK